MTERWFKITGHAGGEMEAKVIKADSITDAREKAELAVEMAGKVLAAAGMESAPITCTIVEMVEMGSECIGVREILTQIRDHVQAANQSDGREFVDEVELLNLCDEGLTILGKEKA